MSNHFYNTIPVLNATDKTIDTETVTVTVTAVDTEITTTINTETVNVVNTETTTAIDNLLILKGLRLRRLKL